MPRQIQTQVQQQQHKPGLLGFLKPFVGMAVGAATGNPTAGKVVDAAMGFLGGNAGQSAAQVVDMLSNEGKDVPGQTSPTEPPSPTETPSTAQEEMESPAHSQPSEGGAVPFDPNQRAQQEQIFHMVEQAVPELPVFLSQNPDFFPAAQGFLAAAQQRYSQQAQQGGPFSG